jgi:hypothetical protein
MAMTVAVAHAVNLLLQQLGVGTDQDELGAREIPPNATREAAALLAEHANKTLMAGLTRADVERAWPRVVQILEAGRAAEPDVVYACCDDPTIEQAADGNHYCSACGQALTAAQVRAVDCEHVTVEAAAGQRSRCPDCRLAFCQAVGSTGDGRNEPMMPDPCVEPATGVKGRWELCNPPPGGGRGLMAQQLRYSGPALREGDSVVVLRVEDLGDRSVAVLGGAGEVDGPPTTKLEYHRTDPEHGGIAAYAVWSAGGRHHGLVEQFPTVHGTYWRAWRHRIDGFGPHPPVVCKACGAPRRFQRRRDAGVALLAQGKAG